VDFDQQDEDFLDKAQEIEKNQLQESMEKVDLNERNES